MTLNDLQKTKAFRRMVTGLRAKQLTELYQKLTQNKSEVVRSCARKFHTLYQEVDKYALANYKYMYAVAPAEITAMVNAAIQFDLWDPHFIVTIKKFEAAMSDFAFITKLQVPTSNDPETVVTEYTELVNSLLLLKKMRHENKLGNMEICVKNDVPLDETKLVNTPTAVAVV